MTRELGMSLEENDLEAWGGQPCRGWECRHGIVTGREGAGKGASHGGNDTGRDEIEQIRESKRLEEIVLVRCLLLPLLFQMDERNSTDVYFKKSRKMGQTMGLFKGRFVVSNELPRGQHHHEISS